MNTKSLIITIVVAFITVSVTDFLIHAVWLSADYGATKELWRPEAEMTAKMPLMSAGQFLAAFAFTMLFANFVAPQRNLAATLKFALLIGLMSAAGQIIMYAVAPWPGALVAKWCVAYLLQAVVLGFVVHKGYRLPA